MTVFLNMIGRLLAGLVELIDARLAAMQARPWRWL